MTPEVQTVLDQAFAATRAELDRLGLAWHRAWYHVKTEKDSSTAFLCYTDRPGGPVLSPDRPPSFDPSDLLLEIRSQVPDAAGRPWNQALLTVYADGRQEVAFDYPGPQIDPNHSYTEVEILANIVECFRHDLVFEQWTEAWLEAGPECVPFLFCQNGPDGHVEQYIPDCNGLYEWLRRLWQARTEAGAGGWSRIALRIRKDDGRIETEFRPPDRTPEPPPLPRRVPPLDELFRRIIAATRADLDDFVRRADEKGERTGGWRRTRLTAYRDEDDGVVYVEQLTEFADGQELDEVADWDVEELFGHVFDRVEQGDDPTGLDVPGLTVKGRTDPRFTLVLRNGPPGRG